MSRMTMVAGKSTLKVFVCVAVTLYQEGLEQDKRQKAKG